MSKNKIGITEPLRTFEIKVYGSSAVVVLDKNLRSLLGIKWDEIEEGKVGLRVENLRKIYLDPKDDPNYGAMDKFLSKESVE